MQDSSTNGMSWLSVLKAALFSTIVVPGIETNTILLFSRIYNHIKNQRILFLTAENRSQAGENAMEIKESEGKIQAQNSALLSSTLGSITRSAT